MKNYYIWFGVFMGICTQAFATAILKQLSLVMPTPSQQYWVAIISFVFGFIISIRIQMKDKEF